jgi:hypothetical protein
MPRPRRSFSPEYRVEAAHRVIDAHRSVAEVARELAVKRPAGLFPLTQTFSVPAWQNPRCGPVSRWHWRALEEDTEGGA